MLQKIKIDTRSVFYFLVPLVVILSIWELLSRGNLVNSVLISRPSEISAILYELLKTKSANGHSILLIHIFTSLYRLVSAFLIAAGAGLGMGILMGTNSYVYRWFDPLITVIMPIPGIAWAPIFMLWLGFGDPTIVAVGALAIFFPIVCNTATGVRSVEKKLIWSAQSMGANRKTIFFRICLPAAAAYIFTGFKLGLARGWRTIIAVEMIAASLWGLGFMIFDAREYLRPSIIYGGILILAIIYLLIENILIKWIERHTVRKWGMIRDEV